MAHDKAVKRGRDYGKVLLKTARLHDLKSSKPELNWKEGAIWGLGLMATMCVAPSLLGLLPETPGTLAQALEHRQIGWLFSAFTTAYLILGVLVAISISDLSLIISLIIKLSLSG